MLVLLSPDFSGSDDDLAVVAEVSGLTPYDLRTRLCRGAYSVVRVLADPAQADALVGALLARGIRAVSIDAAVGQDPSRRVVYARGLGLGDGVMVLRLREREMTIPFPALLCLVRGEVHLGRTPRQARIAGPSGQYRLSASNMAAAGSDPANALPQEVFAAVDLHFVTVTWIARIDARDFDFPRGRGGALGLAEQLDGLVEELARATSARVDRHIRTSSLSSYTSGSQRHLYGASAGVPSSQRLAQSSDDHFDAYSRLVAEAERHVHALAR